MAVNSVLVAGATGMQGGAVVDHLLETDIDVYGLTRAPSSNAAVQLEDRGVTIVKGDMMDKRSVKPLMKDVDGVFCVTDYWEHGYRDEVEQGVNMAEAAAETRVDHFIYSSVNGAQRDPGIPHFKSKRRVEERIARLGIPATVIRPVFFMQNFERMREGIKSGLLAMALERGTSLPMLDVRDLGAFIREAFLDSKYYQHRAVELAGDELTLEGLAVRFSDVTDVDVSPTHLSIENVEKQMGEEYAVMFEWYNDRDLQISLSEIRAKHDVNFSRFVEYLVSTGWHDLE
jgi:uncharacterized protein YbjT (DUF2867 family)